MVARKLNVLVYSGNGTTIESVKHCLYSLRRLLSHNYAVIPISETALLKEPWAPTCALLVMPGGADLGYCKVLNGEGNRIIADFVRKGGAYLGFCAGGYYGSQRCEFEVGDPVLEVVGSRELAFFTGTCRGGAFKGFQYHSEAGARVVELKTRGLLGCPEFVQSYYNGGGVFVPKKMTGYSGYKFEVLASYEEELNVDGGEDKAAAVLCKVGLGFAILTGPHPEFCAENLYEHQDIPGYADLIQKLAKAEKGRSAFLKACLVKLGLDVSTEELPLPSLSPLHLSGVTHECVSEALCDWESIITRDKNGEELIKADMDVFHIQKIDSRWDLGSLKDALEPSRKSQDLSFVNYSSILKTIVPHESEWPDNKETPCFNHNVYFSHLKRYRLLERDANDWGSLLLYGEVMTSTNSILDKNPKLLAKIPTGFTVAATTQIAGRGRGSNVWVSPPGCMIMSIVINQAAHLAMTRPVVFIQYIAAIAIVEAIQSYDTGYGKIPVKIKWPNDIYALDPNPKEGSPTYVKVGGILATCSYCDGEYQIVLGIGVNTCNSRPTTSLNALLKNGQEPARTERLLARLVTRLEAVYGQFLREGFSPDLEARYYRYWLHTGQKVTLEAEGGVKARVLGVTRDWGLLKAEELGYDGRGTGKIWSLQSDENSFDFWKGLIKRKT
ncbi:hypothetical protein TD95_004097 [Thielaviopsis punctulata]|uniref:BPL/LPL catalytic domain-containing protein n=1 Tax=Thielaviopsis punctulata TaxID=72032 RepID=A0A0F4Z9T7_9PEZI|nr:hypothetical protein TD95_004097 [Thielaviopsis punctulata]